MEIYAPYCGIFLSLTIGMIAKPPFTTYIQIYANPEMCLKYLFLGSKRSVLTELIFVQGNNHAADDINSCEFSVNAADHIILCCMDFRIFWNFFMLQDTQKSNAVRHYKFMLS